MFFSKDKDRFLDMIDEEAISHLYQLCGNEGQAKRIYNSIVIETRDFALSLCKDAGCVYQNGYEITDDNIQAAIGNALEMKL